MFSALNDDAFNLTLPIKIEIPFLARLWFLLLTPYTAFYNIPKLSNLTADAETKKFTEMTGPETMNTKYFVSDWIPWEPVKARYQSFQKTSFNDYICGIISVSFYQWMTQNGIANPKEVLLKDVVFWIIFKT